ALPIRRHVTDRTVPVEVTVDPFEVAAREDVANRRREGHRVSERVETRRRVEQQRLQAADAERSAIAAERGERLARESRVVVVATALEVLEAHEAFERDARLPAAI